MAVANYGITHLCALGVAAAGDISTNSLTYPWHTLVNNASFSVMQ